MLSFVTDITSCISVFPTSWTTCKITNWAFDKIMNEPKVDHRKGGKGYLQGQKSMIQVNKKK